MLKARALGAIAGLALAASSTSAVAGAPVRPVASLPKLSAPVQMAMVKRTSKRVKDGDQFIGAGFPLLIVVGVVVVGVVAVVVVNSGKTSG